jgi:hypothetical protein
MLDADRRPIHREQEAGVNNALKSIMSVFVKLLKGKAPAAAAKGRPTKVVAASAKAKKAAPKKPAAMKTAARKAPTKPAKNATASKAVKSSKTAKSGGSAKAKQPVSRSKTK